RLPLATLFPYTTLFRSIGFQDRIGRIAGGTGRGYRIEQAAFTRSGNHPPAYLPAPKTQCADQRNLLRPAADLPLFHQAEKRIDADRKSTRLNSSHVKIS